MSFTPFVYNNRINPPSKPNKDAPDNNTNQHPPQYKLLNQPINQYEQWNRNEDPSRNQPSHKLYKKPQSNYERLPTEANKGPNSALNNPLYTQPYNFTQTNKPNAGELFKSSIYAPQNPYPHTDHLNNSGGRINAFNSNITPPRRVPRSSEPNLYSNSEIPLTSEFLKPPTNANDTALNERGSFNKAKPIFLDSPEKDLVQEVHKNLINLPEKPAKTELLRKDTKEFKSHKNFEVDDFVKIKELGTGKYGRVFLVREKKTGYICALKQIDKKLLIEEQITQQFIRELKIQMYLTHPNIIKLYGFFHEKNTIYIILELGTGGQLFQILKKSQSLPQVKVAAIMRQVCQAVKEIHHQRIIHRDIKPENIVLNDGVVKLCDFGWSVHQDKNLRTTFCGTPLYVCPEILKGKEYDQKIDIWSLGVMMYEMLIGENPFRITKQEELINIIKDQIKIPSYVNISQQAQDFLYKCLRKDPDERCTIRELVEHQFFVKYPQKTNKMKEL